MRLNIRTMGVAPAAVVLGLGLAFGAHPVNAAATGVGDELLNSEAQVTEQQGDMPSADDTSNADGVDSVSNGPTVDDAVSEDKVSVVAGGNNKPADQISSTEGIENPKSEVLDTDSPSHESDTAEENSGVTVSGDSKDAAEPSTVFTPGWNQSGDDWFWYDEGASGPRKGWLVTAAVRGTVDGGLQRYWLDSATGALSFNKLISADEAGWWAYATADGWVVRGKYTVSDGTVYLANNDGKLEDAGWHVSASYGDGLQRYYVDGAAHGCVAGYSSDGWSHYTTESGYVLRGSLKQDGLVYFADNDGRLAGGENGGWVVTSSLGHGLQRYWIDASLHAAKVGYSEDGWAHYTTEDGYVLRGTLKQDNKVYLADNDGKLAHSGWVVSSAYGQGLQRYWVEDGGFALVGYSENGWKHVTAASGYVLRGYLTSGEDMFFADNDGRLKDSGWLVTAGFGQGLQRYWFENGKVARNKLVSEADAGWNAYATAAGYVLRGNLRYGSGLLVANNDGALLWRNSEGWVVTGGFNGGLQRYYVVSVGDNLMGARIGEFSVSGNDYYGRTDTGYVVRGTYVAPNGKVYNANNDGVIYRSLRGIDIASYQGGIDLSRLDTDFVIVKATEGTGYKNPYFANQASSALNSGKLLGFYHFVDTSVSAEAQADYFIDAIAPYIGKAALFLDWENNDVNGTQNLSAGPAFANRFLDRVYARTGVKPMIYMSRSVVHEYDWSSTASAGYGLWVAQYLYKYHDYDGVSQVTDPTIGSSNGHSSTDFGAWGSKPTIYQYTSTGKIDGWNGLLDLNTFYGSSTDWSLMCKPKWS